jgi:hypothetical protein
MASFFENFRYHHPSGPSNGTRPADRKAATTFRGIVARCHASHICITSALYRRYVVKLKRFLKVWTHGAPMGQSSCRPRQSPSRLTGIIKRKSLKRWSPSDRDSENLRALFSKSLGKALNSLVTRNKIQWSPSDNRLPSFFELPRGFLSTLHLCDTSSQRHHRLCDTSYRSKECLCDRSYRPNECLYNRSYYSNERLCDTSYRCDEHLCDTSDRCDSR